MKLFKVSFYDYYQSSHIVVLSNTKRKAIQLAHEHATEYKVSSAHAEELTAISATTEPKAFFISGNYD